MSVSSLRIRNFRALSFSHNDPSLNSSFSLSVLMVDPHLTFDPSNSPSHFGPTIFTDPLLTRQLTHNSVINDKSRRFSHAKFIFFWRKTIMEIIFLRKIVNNRNLYLFYWIFYLFNLPSNWLFILYQYDYNERFSGTDDWLTFLKVGQSLLPLKSNWFISHGHV